MYDESWCSVRDDDAAWWYRDDGEFVSLCRSWTAVVADGEWNVQAPACLPNVAPKGKIVKAAPCDDEERDDATKTRRNGKKAVKAGLMARREDRDGAKIGVVGRARQGDVVATTEIDDMMPELLMFSEATLDRGQRWVKVRAKLDELVEQGVATQLGEWTSTASEVVTRYAIQASGHAKMSRKPMSAAADRRRRVMRRVKGKLVQWYTLGGEPPALVVAARAKQGDACFQPLRGALRAPPKRTALTRKERRAFAPSVAAATGASSTIRDVRAAVNGVALGAVELDFGMPVFVTFVVLSGKIHDTVEISDDEDDDDVKPTPQFRNGVLLNKRPVKIRHAALEGTDAYCSSVNLSARVGNDWVNLGEVPGPVRGGHTEVAVPIGDTLRGGVAGILCTALRFKPVSWHRAPALRVGAFGEPAQSRQNRKGKAKADDDDDVIYEVITPREQGDDDRGRASILHRYARRPSYVKYRCSYNDLRVGRSSKAKIFADEIADGQHAYYATD